MAPFPVITHVESIAPTDCVAKRVSACLYVGPVVLIILRAYVDAFVEAFYYALHGSRNATDVQVTRIAKFAEVVRCAAVGHSADCVVGGRAVAEERGLRAVCWAEDGGCADGLG